MSNHYVVHSKLIYHKSTVIEKLKKKTIKIKFTYWRKKASFKFYNNMQRTQKAKTFLWGCRVWGKQSERLTLPDFKTY